GPMRDTVPDFQSPAIHDELRYAVRKALTQDNVKEAMTFRNASREAALPMRRWQGFMPGTGLGGAAVHWNGLTWRFQPADFVYRTHLEQRYGKGFIDPELAIQDWGVTYDELEPHYDRFEYLCGTSGKAGNIQGAIQHARHPAWRPPLQRPAVSPLPPPADERALLCSAVPQGRREPGVPPVPLSRL